MLKPFYLILILAIVISSCSSKNIPIQDTDPTNQVDIESTPKKSAIDSAQVIKINSPNRKQSILTPSKSKEKKGL